MSKYNLINKDYNWAECQNEWLIKNVLPNVLAAPDYLKISKEEIKNKMKNQWLDGFVTIGENGIGEIYSYTFSFTKYINGLKTDESFIVKVLVDGGIISINHNRFQRIDI